MKKQLLIVAFALFLGTFTQPQSLFAYYPCEFVYPGETGNCEGCGDLSPTDCHRDCAPTWGGYNCSRKQDNSPEQKCLANYNAVWVNNTCGCPAGYSKKLNTSSQESFWCVFDSFPVITLNGEYMVTLNKGDVYVEKGATAYSTLEGDITKFITISGLVNTQIPGIYTVTYSVSNHRRISGVGHATPITRTIAVLNNILPQPTTCEINKLYFYNFSQTPCACPIDSYKVVQTSYGYTGGQSFTCVSNYQPHPSPAPIIMQTCWNGTVIPNTSACPSKPVCSYNQYWSGYSCVDYYQPYIPVIQPVIQYPSVYDWQYYDQQDYNYNWSDTNSWSNVDWVYSN